MPADSRHFRAIIPLDARVRIEEPPDRRILTPKGIPVVVDPDTAVGRDLGFRCRSKGCASGFCRRASAFSIA